METPTDQESEKYDGRFLQLKEFCNNTTLHGVRYLTEKGILRKLVWFLLLCLAFGGCGYQIHLSLSAFYEWPISTVIATKYKENIDFPSVTFCNLNFISKGNYAKIEKQKLISEMKSLHNVSIWRVEATKEDRIENIISLLTGSMNKRERSKRFDQLFAESNGYRNNTSLLKSSLKSYSHSLEGAFSLEWLTPCQWRGDKCGKQNLSSFVDLKVGQCYTFNSGKEGHPRLKADLTGPRNGLRLRLNVESGDHVQNFESVMAGFKVLVHDSKDHPIIEDMGFALQPGIHTYCAVKMKKYKNLPKPYETKCGSNETDFNRFFKVNYSMSTCSKQCLHNYGISKCKCQPIYDITKGVPLCSLKDTFECIYPAFYGTYPEEAADCFKKYCPVPCEQTKYETKLSYASAISNAFARRIPTDGAGSDDESLKMLRNLTEEERKQYFRDNVATLDVYFEELSYDVIEQKGTFDSWSLVANVGGYLGLFLGMSLLTMAEFLDLLVTKVIKACCSAKKTKVTRKGVVPQAPLPIS